MECSDKGGQSGHGAVVGPAEHAGMVCRTVHFVSWDQQRKDLLLKQKWCPPTATARLRLKPGLHPNRPLRTNRAAQALSCRELQNLDVLLGLKAEVGADDTSVPAG